MTIKILNDVQLSQYSTIKLGGKAKYFVQIKTEKQLIEALKFARNNKLNIHILGKGSNTIFADKGFNGLVIYINLKGIKIIEKKGQIILSVKAGEVWDDLVRFCVKNGYGGLECLSGIPGTTGAAPIQNIGAYGQEVSDSIEKVVVLEKQSLKIITFSNHDCQFSYRQSRFKRKDKNKYIILEVVFKLSKNLMPKLKYPELIQFVKNNYQEINLKTVRQAVLKIRQKKSMVINHLDPDSISVGSFFTNPIISQKKFNQIKINYPAIPYFKSKNKVKIPAAWLIEQTKYKKGYHQNGIGISKKHILALVNKKSGTTQQLLYLADKIEKAVFKKFNIKLEKEPVLIL